MGNTFLKLQDDTVMEYDLGEMYFKIFDNSRLPFLLRDTLTDTSDPSTINALSARETQKVFRQNERAMERFFSFRSLSVSRENAKLLLNQLRLPQKDDFDTHIKTMVLCKALSAADDYWITQNPDERWADVDLRRNPLHETLQQIALHGKPLTITGKILTPELTCLGAYAKAWFRENGILYLYKGSSRGGDEAEREALASKVLDCFNVPQVNYTLTEKDGRVVTKCMQMNNNDYCVVDAMDVDVWCDHIGRSLFELSRELDGEMYYKTIVADYLLANVDRHFGNWGFYMSNRTGKLICMHPLFDHNNCFDNGFMENPDGIECQLIPGKKQREAALYAVKRCDFRCLKPVTKDMFPDQRMYESFMSRAVELGLYKKSEHQALGVSQATPYVPTAIKADNRHEYWEKIDRFVRSETAPCPL